MDDIVAKAIQKWPNVPHCFGWLALDARGQWRMRDEQAQQQHLPGDKITNPALINFIVRNYTHDNNGAWYFQNGPQRVYVDLGVAPFIVRTAPQHQLILHTGQAIRPDTAWLTENGRLFLRAQDTVAALEDKDMADCLPYLQINGQHTPDEAILDWIANPDNTLSLAIPSLPVLPVSFLQEEDTASTFGFVKAPRQAPTT